MRATASGPAEAPGLGLLNLRTPPEDPQEVLGGHREAAAEEARSTLEVLEGPHQALW